MPDSWDDSFDQISDEPALPPARKAPAAAWIAGALLLVAAVSAFFYFRSHSAPEEAAAAKPAPAAAVKPDRAQAAAVPVDLPPLDQSDPLVRELLRKLSNHPQVAAWLATDGLIRNFTVVVTNMAEGKTPARWLRQLRPTAPFTVSAQGGNLYIDARSYDRYTRIAEAVASIDPAGAVQLYSLLKPRIEEASAELGNTEPFDRMLDRAMKPLIDVSIPEGPVRVMETGATGYKYAESALEELTAAQKLLLRMGPQNGHVVQDKLRAVAAALPR